MTAQNSTWPTPCPGFLRSSADRLFKVLYAVTHSGMALLGLGLALVTVILLTSPELRGDAEQKLLGWLQQRQNSETTVEDESKDRTDAVLATSLPKEQAQVASWISRRYRVAPEPVGALVAEAFAIGSRIKLDPTLILAVMAIESRFNPFAQSPVGAQGLMQVLTRVHSDKYEDFGGKQAAFDPLVNLRVGVQVLQDCIRNAGSIEGGLRRYVGAVDSDGNGYVAKVMAEQQRLRSVARGAKLPINAGAPVLVRATPAKSADDKRELEADAGVPATAKLQSS